MTEPFKDAPFIPSHDSPVSSKPVHLWNVPGRNRYFLSIPQLPQLSHCFVATGSAFLEHVASFKFKRSDYLEKKNTIKFISLNITNLVFVVYLVAYRLNKICKS
ncbi:hypothetical protein ILYODFUR_037074 [Ilyodon furcidens]|uniref:Uncharacterized protein n=1 Tax=Ilyodon furcidens TaxID=33524 RepID=A0ABV0U2R1_9TELE